MCIDVNRTCCVRPLSRRERARVRACNWRQSGFICSAFVTVGVALLLGCGKSEPAAPPETASPEATAETPPPPPPPPPTVPTPTAPPATVQTKAEIGVGEKGRGYGTGPVATPVAAYFAAKERIAFDIQSPPRHATLQGHGGPDAKIARRIHGEDHQASQIQPTEAARGPPLRARSQARATDGRAAGPIRASKAGV